MQNFEPNEKLTSDVYEYKYQKLGTKKRKPKKVRMKVMRKIKKNQLQQLKDGPVYRTLLSISLPTMIGFTSNILSNTIQSIIIGQFLGNDQLTAQSNFLPTEQTFFQQTSSSFAKGAGTLISNYIGADQIDKAERLQAQVYFVALIFAVFFPVLFLPWLPTWLTLLGVTEIVLPYTLKYGYPVTIAMPFVYSINNLSALLRCQNKAIVSMSRQLFGNLLCIICTLILIGGLKMDISGAAYSLIISYGISGMWLFIYLFTKSSTIKLRCKNFKPNLRMMLDILWYGFPAFINVIPTCLVPLLSTIFLNKYGGSEENVDKYQMISGIINRIYNLYQQPISGLTNGMQPILGYSLSQKNYKRVFEIIWKQYTLILGIGLVLLLFIEIFATFIVSWFTQTEAVYAEAARLMRISISGAALSIFLQVEGLILQQERKTCMSVFIQMIRLIVSLSVLIIGTVVTKQFVYVFYNIAIGDIVGGIVGICFMISTFVRYNKLRKLPANLIHHGPSNITSENQTEKTESSAHDVMVSGIASQSQFMIENETSTMTVSEAPYERPFS